MAETVFVSGPELFLVDDGAIDVPQNSSNSTTTQSAFGNPGGSTHLECRIAVEDPGDSDHAWGGVESAWAFLTNSPGNGPLRLRIQFGALGMRAFGNRNNEAFVFSSHEVYAGLRAFARVVIPEVRDLSPGWGNDHLISFWNVDLGPENEARMRWRTPSGYDVINLSQDRWDRTQFTTTALEFRYTPSEAISEGDLVMFVVGFRLMISAPLVDDYDFRLATNSTASIAWVTLDSE
jgi:hypothetical protein